MDNGGMNGDDRWLMILMALLITVLMLWSMWSCRTSRQEPADSVRTEYRYVEKLRTDTAYVQVPLETVRTVTRDTVSWLQTEWAWSEARVDSLGLHHSLGTVRKEIPVRVEARDVVRDSIAYRNIVYTKTVEKPLTWWQKTQIYGFRLFAMTAAAWLLVCAVRKWLNGSFLK